MKKGKKAVYYIHTSRTYGHVGPMVWDILHEGGYLDKSAGIVFAGEDVKQYVDAEDNTFYFVPTEKAICLSYPRYLPEMNRYFGDCDIAGMVTWHEGENAPSNILTVHSLGDVNAGVFGFARPKYMRNLLLALENNRLALGLADYRVVTEATHWSGSYQGSDAALLNKYPVSMMDIEVGSSRESWYDKNANTALARALLEIFKGDGKTLHNVLCIGGVHFDPNFAEAAFASWGNDALAVTHTLANQWLVSGRYEDETGLERIHNCVRSIEDGVEAVLFHDKLKGCYKDLARRLGEELQIPIFRHQRARVPQELNL